MVDSRFLTPLYESLCFSRIPATIQSLLGKKSDAAMPQEVYGTKEYDYVIFILLDGFGWNLFEKNKSRFPFLDRFIQQGRVHQITSMFPSTTTGHITCLHTTLTPGITGLYEWYCYEPLIGAPIIPLRFAYAFDKDINTLLKQGVKPEEIFPFPTFYNMLHEHGITSYIFQPKDISNSPYSKTLQKGAENIGYKTFREGLNKLKRTYLETKAQKAYFFFYYPEIDSYSHSNGLQSAQLEKELMHCFAQLEQFWQTFPKTDRKTVCIVGADHGHAAVDPKQALFLNTLFPDIIERFQVSPKGVPIVPCGSSRAFFLHIKPELLEETKILIETALEGKAKVYFTKELIDKGLFGPISDRFLARVGNLVILPFAPITVWWNDKRLPQNDYFGHHGGLSADEIQIPFLIIDL